MDPSLEGHLTPPGFSYSLRQIQVTYQTSRSRACWPTFVVRDRDTTSVLPPKVLETKVLRTVVGGKTVYEAN
jgi:hypothetical protein